MSIRVRFAPSPTGYLHVGGARTALFNWLFARKSRGSFVLRIEDTDRERSSEEMSAGIVEALSWMGLDWDEGPYYQSERSERHVEVARELLEARKAYYCFCQAGDLALQRERAGERQGDWIYPRTCLGLDATEVQRRLEQGVPAGIRFRVPEERIEFEDQVFGRISKDSRQIEDFVLLRSDGRPTYQLGVVVDDLDMRLTHVIRGADHISNTPKQILLYRAMDRDPPAFAHLPLILGPDKARLSKRHGATSVLAYRDEGIMPEALNNFLALLGWSDATDRELFDMDALVDAFSLEGISKANAVFDSEKLKWFNGQYIQALPAEALAMRLRPFLEKAGLWEDRFEARDRAWFHSLIVLLRPRFRSLERLAAEVAVYTRDGIEYEAEAVGRFWKDRRLAGHLTALAGRLEAAEPFDLETTEDTVRALAGELGVKAGLLINGSRVALTGKGVAPGIFDVMVVLGRDRTIERLRRGAAALDEAG